MTIKPDLVKIVVLVDFKSTSWVASPPSLEFSTQICHTSSCGLQASQLGQALCEFNPTKKRLASCIMNSTRGEIQLPSIVENRLMELYQRHMLKPIDANARLKLRDLGEEKSVRVLTNLTKIQKIHNLNALITYMVNKEMMSFEKSPSTQISSSAGVVISGLKSPCQSAVVLRQSPLQPLAIGEERLRGGANEFDDLCDEVLLSIDIEKIMTPAKPKDDISINVPQSASRSGACLSQDTEKLVVISSLPKSSQGSAPGMSQSNEGMLSPEHIPYTPPSATTPSNAQKKRVKITSAPSSGGNCEGEAAVNLEMNNNVLPFIIPRKLEVHFNSTCDVPSSPQALRCGTSGGSMAAGNANGSVLPIPKIEQQIQEGKLNQHVHHFQPSWCQTLEVSMGVAHTSESVLLIPKTELQIQEGKLDQHVHHFQPSRCRTPDGCIAAAHTSESVLLVPETELQIQEGKLDQHVHHFQPSRCQTSDGSMAAVNRNSSDMQVPKSELQMQKGKLDQHVHHFQPSALSGGKSEFIWPEITEQVQMFGELSFVKRFLILDHAAESQALPPVSELKVLKDMSEREVDNRLFHQVDHSPHTPKRDWSKAEACHLVFNCDVNRNGDCKFMGPFMEPGSTPLQRAFHEENVLRVNFEDIGKNDHVIQDRYRALAKVGILCGLKRFVFYAYKDAQAKKNQGVTKNHTFGVKCIFISLESRAAFDVHNGRYRSFKNIAEARAFLMHATVPTLAKSISRYQLALSETCQIITDFKNIKVEEIEDIFCQDEKRDIVRDVNGKPLIHTDGVGYISKNLAMLCQEIVIKGVKRPEKDKQEYPLMMQVRLFYNGNVWKGVLLVNCLLPENTIQVRDSMLKVKHDDALKSPTFNSLELCNTSRKPRPGKLFQHLILLLKQGRVQDEVFMLFVNSALDKIRTCFTNVKAAFKVAVKNKENNQNGELACQMLMAGLMPKNEPFLQKILWDMVKGRLHEYAKGKVPVSKSMYLMGCSDPSGLLQRNQVTIILEDGAICRSKVLVYKPPGLHPGDIHIFEAVWNRAIEDVVGKGTHGIVFSTQGARSVTDEMAGSDLDGDQYWVCWHPEIVDNFTPSAPWEAPNEPTSVPVPKRPLDEDEFDRKHFDKYLEARFNPSSIKGMAANNWLAQADYVMTSHVDGKEKALVMERISQLVDLFYKAVDADKSGEKVRWLSHLQCRQYPHYMEKNKDDAEQESGKPWSKLSRSSYCGLKIKQEKHDEYISDSILGKLYDLVKLEDHNLHSHVEIVLDKTFACEGYETYYNQWQAHFLAYKRKMRDGLSKSDNHNFKNCLLDNLIAEYRKVFYGEGKPRDQLFLEASAIYTVVYSLERDSHKESPSLQFAWKVAGKELCQMFAEQHGSKSFYAMSTDVFQELNEQDMF